MKRTTNAEKGLMSRVYTYGTVPNRVAPVLNEEVALRQMWLGNRLWNVLVSIEKARMADYRRIMSDENQVKVDQLKEEITALQEQIKQRFQRARKRVDVSDLKEEIKAKKEERGKILDILKSTKEARLAARKIQLDFSSETAQRRVRRARQAASRMGLFWGTYNDIVQRADAGSKLGDIKYRSFKHTGTLTTQIMGGATVNACVGGKHTFFQIDPAPEFSDEEREWANEVINHYADLQRRHDLARLAELDDDVQRARTVRRKWRYARIRIGSLERAPIWVQIPIVYQRDLPPDSLIKSVSVTRRIVAGEVRWQLNVTVTQPIPAAKPLDKILALDIGWRLREDGGVRVGYWRDTDDLHGEVLVSASDISQFKLIDDLKSNCDLHRDEFLPALCAWIDQQELSVIWKHRTAHLEKWKSSDRIESLVAWWRDNRLPNDDEMFEAAREWRKQYLHLALWRRNLQDQMTGRIREQYRVFASKVAKKYSHVIIENFDMREMIKTKKKPVETEPKAGGEARGTYRQMVSPSRLRDVVRNALQREGVTLVERPAAYTTLLHSSCMTLTKWNAAESIMHKCEFCGEEFDQDHNAAINLLMGWLTEHRGPGISAAA